MTIQRTRFWFSALLLGAASSFANPGSAQSLALAYDLAIGTRAAAPAPRPSDSCDAKYDTSRLLECGGNLPEDMRWMRRGTAGEYSGPDIRSHAEVPNANAARPTLETRLRLAADADEASTAEDVPIRLGLKYRVRRHPGSFESYGLTDARFESWAQRKEFNLVGVEVLFRFH